MKATRIRPSMPEDEDKRLAGAEPAQEPGKADATEAQLDEAVADTFPASDPIAVQTPEPAPTGTAVAAAEPPSLMERVRERAHRLWEEEGRPEGREAEHWHRAEAEIAAEGGTKEAAKDAEGATDHSELPPSARVLATGSS